MMRKRSFIWLFPFLSLFCFTHFSVLYAKAEQNQFEVTTAEDFLKVFDEVVELVNTKFCDANFNGVNWMEISQQYRKKIATVEDKRACYDLINEMLATLKVSHTHLYSQDDPWYYIFKSVFTRVVDYSDRIEYPQIGIFTQKIGEDYFILAILEGSPADKAGLKRGDWIISVDGEPFFPVNSFRGKEKVTLLIQRQKEQAPIQIQVTPEEMDAQEAFALACMKSIKVIPIDNKKIGYIHIWGGIIEDITDAFERGLVQLNQAGCQGLILDIRDGIGGHSYQYFDPLQRSNFPFVKLIDRSGKERLGVPRWEKPIVLLINDGVRSGKEIFAYAMKKSKRATLVGSNTAGEVAGGAGFPLSDGSLLYLAIGRTLIDGETLEGKGVPPDVFVESPLEYSAGEDLPLEKAISLLLKQLEP
ncbi:peptidase S41 [Candidatus Poribacteria bacterium]|nr:peptidase S41 [Candidatus Poribacteria bacterium]